jgi:hypothetical protein
MYLRRALRFARVSRLLIRKASWLERNFMREEIVHSIVCSSTDHRCVARSLLSDAVR